MSCCTCSHCPHPALSSRTVAGCSRLTAPSELRFLLRSDRVGEQLSDSPAVPLADLAAVESLFDSLARGGSIYGWRFFDDPELTSDWPVEASLAVQVRDTSARLTFYWFNECGVEHDGATATYCIEGTVAFDDLLVLDASGSEIPTETFIADGVRQWDALYVHDERLTVDAQREAQQGAPKWRKWATAASQPWARSEHADGRAFAEGGCPCLALGAGQRAPCREPPGRR